ncbi:MAG: polyprenyl synthetase family protein, partial [Pseudomonadota bacterium]
VALLSKATGKNVGDDFRERKLTLPVIKAVAQANEEEHAFWQRTIEKGDQNDGDLAQALRLLDEHNALDQTKEDAKAWSEKAKSALTLLPQHPVRDMLHALADYVVARIR